MVTFGSVPAEMIDEIVMNSYLVGLHYGCTLQLARNVALAYFFKGDDSLEPATIMLDDLMDGANARCRI